VNEPVTEERLSEETAALLRDVARARTHGSAPFPRVARAIRRDRRRRAAGRVTLAVVAVVTATLATSVVNADRATPPAKRSATPTPTPTATTPRKPEPGPDSNPFHLAGRTAGALGSDTAWLQGMRQRLVRERKAPDAAHARVLWATDHRRSRFALTIAQDEKGWRLESWAGDAGAAPAAMTLVSGSGLLGPDAGARKPDRIVALAETFRPPGAGSEGDGLLLVVGEGLSGVEVASRFDYTADGRKTGTWRPLAPEGAVWVVEATATEIDGMTLRARASGGDVTRPEGGRVRDEDAPLVDVASVSPAASDKDVLICATMAFTPEVGGMPAGSTPILGGTPVVGNQWFGIAVARAPGGGYLVGSCPTRLPDATHTMASDRARGFVVPAPEGGPAELFVLVPSHTSVQAGTTSTISPAAVVIAPEGATEVEVAGKTAAVHDRLAVVTGLSQDEGLTAIARDASGRELGRTGEARTEGEVAQRTLIGCPPRGSGPYCARANP
jgi:hypothetical protein